MQKLLVGWGQATGCVGRLVWPKEEGGLGLKDLPAWNKCLLLKLLWRIHMKEDTLWIQWIHHRYLAVQGVWEVCPHSSHSALFRSLLSIRDRLVANAGSTLLASNRMEAWHSRGMVREAYKFFTGSRQQVEWFPMVWSNCIQPKMSFICWLALKGRLLTKDRIHHMEVDQLCALCAREEETIEHIFFHCGFVQQVWNKLAAWLRIPVQSWEAKGMIRSMRKLSVGRSWRKKKLKMALATMMYYIWILRNAAVFNQVAPSVSEIVAKVQTYVYRTGYGLYPSVSILD